MVKRQKPKDEGYIRPSRFVLRNLIYKTNSGIIQATSLKLTRNSSLNQSQIENQQSEIENEPKQP